MNITSKFMFMEMTKIKSQTDQRFDTNELRIASNGQQLGLMKDEGDLEKGACILALEVLFVFVKSNENIKGIEIFKHVFWTLLMHMIPLSF